MPAAALGLPVAHKKDSQGICFLGSISVEDFLRAELGSAPGTAIDEAGGKVGEHTGAVLHTLGERIALKNAPSGPWYVVRKLLAENVLVVSRERAGPRTSEALPLLETNWLADIRPDAALVAQYRYHGPRVAGTLSADRLSFTPSEPLPDMLAPGQSVVIYDHDECLGGGIMA